MIGFSMVFWLGSFLGCSPCQSLCDDMAKKAEECGYEVTKEMISECREQQGERTREEKQDCRAVQPKLEEAWDCDELEIYFSTAGSSNTGSDDTASN